MSQRTDVKIGEHGAMTFGSGPGPRREAVVTPPVAPREKEADGVGPGGSMWLRKRQPLPKPQPDRGANI